MSRRCVFDVVTGARHDATAQDRHGGQTRAEINRDDVNHERPRSAVSHCDVIREGQHCTGRNMSLRRRPGFRLKQSVSDARAAEETARQLGTQLAEKDTKR